MLLKTKQVSDELGVNPTTVQRWVKYFDLSCEKNELGHFLFSNETLEELKSIKNDLRRGYSMEKIKSAGKNNSKVAMVSPERFEQRLDRFSVRLEQLERQLDEKANEVITVQVLQHRSELEELVKKVSSLEEKLSELEDHTSIQEAVGQSTGKGKRPWIMSLFSF
ncbi:MerR family transcriptional regulator [Alkalihalobacillus hwajinpoensis]|uniref:MerR family transcriptional regulator n=1 Tax=Guptibacillus hwajinpoensis TaxID=208199 RepID=UPI0018843BB9|nr:MerR family transcriptional regulator [Pseudalkalibacillus hwajinpoensis]MBF0708960.1 MerR family transcriptional regulator [Pseudalkalibacillus hwajinpoensis]